MGLISPNNKRYFVYFDKVPRSQVIEKLWSFIFASGWAEKETNTLIKKKNIVNRLQHTFDIAQEKGSGSYGNDPDQIERQFSRQYTIGWDLGIWKDSSLNLSDNARDVFNGSLSIMEYVTRFSANLFQYIEGVGYTHPLYLTCKYAIDNNKKVFSKDDFLKILPNTSPDPRGESEFSEHTQMWMNYLSVTYFFEKEKKGNSFNLIFKDEFPPEKIITYCNLEYKESNQDETQLLFKDDLTYANYITKKLIPLFYYDFLNIIENSPVFQNKKSKPSELPYQQIFSGAPGTGKSYELKRLANHYFAMDSANNFERITFYPNMTYGQFIGVFKPFPSGDIQAPITYKFVPGILLKQLEQAYLNPDQNYLVLIEEINRANVAAVFGDTFQLLDRNNGVSEYPIAISEDIFRHLYDEETGILRPNSPISGLVRTKLEKEGLYFPDNFYLWASMNGADQGVMPMDTAFKRRWEFVKFDVNDLGENGEEFFENKYILCGNTSVSWNELRIAINKKMLALKIPEDKLIGPYFLSKEILEDDEKRTSSFESKVLMYLFDDAAKMKRSSFFNLDESDMHYSALLNKFRKDGLDAFKGINIEGINELVSTSNVSDIMNTNLMELPFITDQKLSDIRINLLVYLDNKLHSLFDNVEFGQVSNGIYIKQINKEKLSKFAFIEYTGKNDNSIFIRLGMPYDNSMPNFSEDMSKYKDKFKTRFKLQSNNQIDEIIPYIQNAWKLSYSSDSNEQEY